MKKIIALITLILCCFLLAACQGPQGEKGDKGDKGDPGESGIISYDGTEGLDFYPFPDGTYGVMAGKTIYLEEIVIPAEYNGKKVTKVLEGAFGGGKNLVSVSLPMTVTSIGDYVFYNCSSLTTVEFEGTVEQWNAISLGRDWNYNVPATEVICSDGVVPLN